MEVIARAALPFVLLTFMGCAPSTSSLVAQHHDREALCALGFSSDDDPIIRDALWRDLSPRVQVSHVDVGDATLHAVMVRVATNAIPIDELRLHPSSPSRDVGPWEVHSLARMTHEGLPSSRTVGGAGPIEGFAVFMIAVLTVGLVRLELSRPRTEYPSEDEQRRAAPRAFELSRRFESECTRPEAHGVAARCTFALAVRSDAQSPEVDLHFDLSAHAEARESCRMTRAVRVPLTPSDEFRLLP